MRRPYPVGLLVVAIFVVVLAPGSTGRAFAESENKQEVSARVSYAVRGGVKFATTQARFRLQLHGDGPQRVTLLRGDAPLQAVETSSDRIRILREDGRYLARLPGRGKHEITLRFPLRISEKAGARSVVLRLMKPAACVVEFRTDRPDIAVRTAPEAPQETLADTDGTAGGGSRWWKWPNTP